MFPTRLLILPLLLVPGANADEASDDAWKVVATEGGLTVSERGRAGSSLREFRGIGTIEAAPTVVKRVLDDVGEYPNFMPYVVEARVLREEKGARVTYQRIAPPMVAERDYTIRARFETRRTKEGLLSFLTRWQTANDLGPATKAGVTRVGVSEGSWLLEPAERGATQATYSIFTDSGGTLPAFVANSAGKSAIPRLFTALRKQVKLPKYQAVK